MPRCSLALLALAFPLVACNPEPEPEPLPGPCDSYWGEVPSAGRIYVDAAASQGGDGSAEAPFTTLTEALEEARATGVRSIVLAPGEYPGTYPLSEDIEAWQDSDLDIAGCGREATFLPAIEQEESVGDSTELRVQPLFDVTGAQTADIHVHDLAVSGGRRALMVRLGAGALGPIVFEDVDVLDSQRLGVLVDGATSAAHLLDVVVDGVVADPVDGQFGWGVAVQAGALLDTELPEPTVLQEVTVTGVQGFGVFADGGWVQVTDSEITDVEKVSGRWGRGLHLQQWTMGTLEGVSVSGVSDAAVFLESPGRLVEPIEVYDCLLGPTDEADVADPGGETAADGLVAAQAAAVPSSPADFPVLLDGTELTGNPRVHALADAVTLEVGADNIFGDGAGYPLASQDGAVVQGIGGGEPGHEVDELAEAEVLPLNLELPELDQVGAE